ncbi:MAG: hypothetical protein PHQ53_09810 [Candidatus Krumholzibacteria bacterium]|nr:hypothetical protein [Candidatus Krumholzibacteria bacterium]
MTNQTFIICAGLDGKIQEDIDEAIATIRQSFIHPELSSEEKRTLTIKLTFVKRSPDSNQIIYTAETTTKIPATAPRSGVLETSEYNAELTDITAQQMELDLQAQQQAAAEDAEFAADEAHAPGGDEEPGNGADKPKRGRPRKNAPAAGAEA